MGSKKENGAVLEVYAHDNGARHGQLFFVAKLFFPSSAIGNFNEHRNHGRNTFRYVHRRKTQADIQPDDSLACDYGVWTFQYGEYSPAPPNSKRYFLIALDQETVDGVLEEKRRLAREASLARKKATMRRKNMTIPIYNVQIGKEYLAAFDNTTIATLQKRVAAGIDKQIQDQLVKGYRPVMIHADDPNYDPNKLVFGKVIK